MKKYFFLVLTFTVFFTSCGKEDKPEYVDEKHPDSVKVVQPKTEKENPDVNKTDTNKPVNSDDKFKYQRSEVPVAVISPLDADKYIGKYVTVKGLVVDVYQSDKVAYLNFVKKYPDNPFSAVIFSRMFESFGDVQVYANSNVEVTGRVSSFRGKPQIILDKTSQVKIVN
ncbi:MAG TPA: hypothetical protein VI461_02840 [Chitinophagaceae bacterium]|nr:hypothetical protein [Chitinophagaceae bacterium]